MSPIIGLDGCYIRHDSRGLLLSAIGRDGNNHLFPIACAMVEVECKSSWAWFIHYLLEAIGQVEEHYRGEDHNARTRTNAGVDGLNDGVQKEKVSEACAIVGESSTPVQYFLFC